MKYPLFLFTLFFASFSFAVIEGHKYPFDNQTDIQRFQALAEELRCPKCQNQNLADSNAPIARDMRDKVYELMQEGKSDDEVVGYLVDRYGDFVRYNPPMRSETFLLWFGPVIVFLLGLILLFSLRRGQKETVNAPLTAEEQTRLAQLKSAAPKTETEGKNK